MGLTAALYESDNVTKVRDLEDDFAREFQLTANDAGSHSVGVDIEDSAQLADCTTGRMVRYSIDGFLAFTGRIEEPNITTKAPDEDIDQVAEVVGRGHISEWDDCRVYPPLGVSGLPTTQTRYFNWAAPELDDSGWAAAVQNYSAVETPGGDPPKNWPYYNDDFWIWSRGPSTSHPLGSSYFRRNLTVAADCIAVINITADDGFDLWVDGCPIFINTEPAPAETWRETYTAGVRLTAGEHTFAIRGENYYRDWAPTGFLNVAGVLCNVVQVSATGLPDTAIVHTDSTWVCVDYPDSAPGLTAGEIITILHGEEAARTGSPLADWVLDFTEKTDSLGNPFPTLGEVSFPCGSTSLLDVLKQLSDAGFIDFRAMPGSKTLQVYVKDTVGATRAVTLGDTNVVSANFKQSAPIINTLITRWKRGWLEVANLASVGEYGRRTGDLQLGQVDDEDAARSISLDYVNLYGNPRTASTFEILPASDDEMPISGLWTVFDSITGYDTAGSPAVLQCRSLTVADSDDLVDSSGVAAVEFTAEFDSRIEGDINRLTATMARMAPGSFGGRSSSASPAPDLDSGFPTGRVREVHIDASSQTGQTIVDISGRWVPPETCRINSIKGSVKVRDTLAPVAFRLLINGNPVGLAAGSTTIATNTFEVSGVYENVFATPFDYVQIEVTDAGTVDGEGLGLSENLVVQLSASAIGVAK